RNHLAGLLKNTSGYFRLASMGGAYLIPPHLGTDKNNAPHNLAARSHHRFTYDANEAFRASPPFMFVATALRISILGSVYHTYKVYSPDSSSSNEAPLVHVRPLPSVSKAN
ncbi:hypothetical protein V5799_025371, partial [Amblyomma americanum]